MNEPMHEGLRTALGKLRESTAAEAAPVALEAELRKAFRAHHAAKNAANNVYRRRKKQHIVWAAAGALAASMVVAVILARSGPVPAVGPKAPAFPTVAERSAEEASVPSSNSRRAAAVRKANPKKRRMDSPPLRVADKQPSQPRRFPTDGFVEIPYAPFFMADDEGQVVRVSMPGASVRSMGIPVMMDRVQADVLVGNDGLARAIRVVSNSGLNSNR